IYVNPPRGLYIYAEKNKTAQGSFSIINTGYDVLDWTVEVPNDCNWIKSVSPLSGSCGRSESIEVTVTVDSNGFDLHELYWYWAPLVIDSPQISSPVNYYITLRIYEPNEIHVPYDYPTIQQAVDAAQLYGDMIIVHPGRYAGCNTKAKSLTIRSTEPNNQNIVASTIIGSSIYDSYNEENHYIEINGLSLIWNNDTLPSLRSGLSLAYQDICISNCVIKKWLNGGISIGGYYSLKSKSLIDNCLIIENGNYGISINSVKTFGLDLIIQNCTIAGTKPYYLSNRYGIHIRDSSNNKIYVKNCILKNVTLPGDYEIYRESLGYPSSVTDLDVSYSCIPAGPNSIYIGDANYVNFTYGPGNIESDPCFVREGYLNDNNTPTDSNDDFWVDGDYHLKSRYGCWMPSEFVKMDAKGDAFLDMTDFAVLADEWGKTSQKQIDYPYYPYLYPYLRADLDNSGKVDINDLMIFCENYLYDYDQGWWVTDDVTSPCIDAGDPATPLGDEPSPNGGIINMGAYGGTSQASKSP
ncbi:MAG: right-handed parallel beta-helix repeat-containing protein, partial [Planctomycetota bacterium]